MGANDGAVLAFNQLVNNGANNLRYNIVLVAEGYTAAELPLFRTQCRAFLRALFWTAPFDTLRCTFNVFALEASSTASGTDDPATCGDGSTGSGAMPATFFDSTTCGGGRVRRVITVDGGAVRNRVAGFLPQAHSMLVLVNSTLDGGVGGDVAVFTAAAGWVDIALHEFGHLLGLADEYGCYVCDRTDDDRTYDRSDSIRRGYGAPDEPNVSDTSVRANLKWASRVAATTPLPTTPGSVPGGTVGAFESAKYYDFGLFRPEASCWMRTRGVAFCAVCRGAIVSYLSPWTPTTTCVPPTATPPTLSMRARVGRKVMISAGHGGYETALESTNDLPGTPALTYRIDAGAWRSLPAPPVVQAPINQALGPYVYAHTLDVQGQVRVADLDYWTPANSTFMSAIGSDSVALLQPDNAANVLAADYGDPGNIEGGASVSIRFGGVRAGNGRLYVGWRKYYTRIAVSVRLHAGYFGPDDNPRWAPRTIAWSPAPARTAGLTAFYDVTFDPSGLCSLDSDPSNVVDPEAGFRITATGKDAIGQPFSTTGTLRPTTVDYSRSISTVQVARIPKREWPMRFDIRERVLDVVSDGVVVASDGQALQIGDVEVMLETTSHG